MKIILHPNKILSRIAEPVGPEKMDEVKGIVNGMITVMRRNRGLGLAAPQIGISKRIIVWTDQDREKFYVAINPIIVSSRGKIKISEGCLSLPNIHRSVNRRRVIKVAALDEDARRVTFDLANTDAVIVQHEIDHLNGITIMDNTKKRNQAERNWNESSDSKRHTETFASKTLR